MEDCTLASTPIYPFIVDFQPHDPEDKAPTELVKRYQLLIGSLLYPCNWTRPDIAWAVGKLCQFLYNPTELYMEAAM